jgi:hypothetical protein
MTRDRASGAALVAGTLAMLVTMTLHPTGPELAEAVGKSVWPARINVFAHGLAIASSSFVFFGALGLTRRLTTQANLAILALVIYGFALVAVLTAAVASGLIAPHLIDALARADATQRPMLDTLFRFNFQVNQAFATVYVALSSAAIVLWSAAILRSRLLARWIGVYGCVVGVLLLLGLVGGHLRLDVHRFGAIVIAQAIWLVAIGATLFRANDANDANAS